MLSLHTIAFAVLLPLVGQSLRLGPTSAQAVDLERLVRDLGSSSYTARERAHRALSARKDAMPLLKRAQKSQDEELRARATTLVNGMLRQRREANFERLLRLEEPPLDELIEHTVVESQLSAPAWKALQRSFASIRANIHRLHKFSVPDVVDYAKFPVLGGGRLTLPKGLHSHRVVARTADCPAEAMNCFFVCGDSLTTATFFQGVRAFCTGDVRAKAHAVANSFIFCDGDLNCEALANCVVITRGSIICQKPSQISVLIAQDNVRTPGNDRDSQLVIHAKMANYVRVFDVSSLGMETDWVGGRLCVKSVSPENPFVRAGIKSGDLVKKLDGAELKSSADFRRPLRRAHVRGTDLRFTVERNGEDLTIDVSFFD
jgi:PDZ domain